MRGMRIGAIAILTIGLLAGSAIGALAQAEAGEPVGVGGRVEVTEAGFAITLPDDWVHVRPQASDLAALSKAVAAVDPDLAAVVEQVLAANPGMSLPLLAYAPVVGSFAENCNMIILPTGGLSQALLVGVNLSQLGGLGWEPTATTEALPVGEVARIDFGHESGGQELEQTTWLYIDGDTQLNLTCTAVERPDDGWRTIAETVEYLPVEQ